VRAIVDLLDSESQVNVLSTPSLLVLNNKQATINVGQQIPINSAFVNTGTTGSSTVVQFRDTGITLTVIPRVNPGGLVFMEIQQEDSTPGTAVGDANPPVNQKIIQTEVAVQSGQTVLLAGLIKQTDTLTESGVPGLRKVPVLGRLFGSTSKSVDRSELIVLITPTVIENPQRAAELTLEYQQRLKGLEPLLRQKAELERARDAARESVREAKEEAALREQQAEEVDPAQ
jgi:general secretion pathway protein D